MIAGKALADGGVEKNGLRGDIGVPRKVRTELRLDKSIGGEELIEGSKGLESGGATTESAILIACGAITLPCRLKIEPERRLENITRFRPNVVSPTPPYHV